ncbi:MAG: hypothetical protein QXD12_04010, partial [Candidatus Nezhaarchaeales archaeon]
GRTRKLITLRAPEAAARNLGKGQFSIDGAIYMALKVAQGVELSDIPVADSLTLKCGDLEIYLPFSYPLVNGKPVISPKLIDCLLKTDIVQLGFKN